MSYEKWQFEMSIDEPQWSYWVRHQSATVCELAAMALNVNPGYAMRVRGAYDLALFHRDFNLACSIAGLSDCDLLFIREFYDVVNPMVMSVNDKEGELRYTEGTQKIRFIDFAKWASSCGIGLPAGFPSISESPESTAKLDQAYRLIAEMMVYIKDSKLNTNQTGVIRHIDGLGIPSLSRSSLDKVFTVANKTRE